MSFFCNARYPNITLAIIPLDFHEAMMVICDYGLAEIGPQQGDEHTPKGYRMHRCVHSWMEQCYLSERRFARLATFCVCVNSLADFKKIQRAIPHGDRCYEDLSKQSMEELFGTESFFTILSTLANMYAWASLQFPFAMLEPVQSHVMLHNMAKAETIYQILHEKTESSHHSYNVEALLELKNIYLTTRRFSTAREMFQLLLQIPKSAPRRPYDTFIRVGILATYVQQTCYRIFWGAIMSSNF